MNQSWQRIRLAAVVALPVAFGLIVTEVMLGMKLLSFSILAWLALFMALLGVALIILTFKLRDTGAQKIFILMTGCSAVGMPLFAVLHNVVYGLYEVFFGENFWRGGDEVVFFLLALLVCPILLLVGWIGSVVCLLRSRPEKLDSVVEG